MAKTNEMSMMFTAMGQREDEDSLRRYLKTDGRPYRRVEEIGSRPWLNEAEGMKDLYFERGNSIKVERNRYKKEAED